MLRVGYGGLKFTTSIDSTAIPSYRGHEDYPAPSLIPHMFNNPLDKNKRSPQINVDRMIEFLERNIPYLRDALAIPSIRDENIRPLSMFSIDLLEHRLDLVCGGDVHLMRGDAERRGAIGGGRVFGFELFD